MADESQSARQRLDEANEGFRGELRQLGEQLETLSGATEKGSDEIASRLSRLMTQMTAAATESQQRLENASKDFRAELQQLGAQLGNIFNVTEKGNGELATRISELMVHMAVEPKAPEKAEPEQLVANAEE